MLIWDGVAVGIKIGAAQVFVEAGNEFVRLYVLQLLGYIVYLVPMKM